MTKGLISFSCIFLSLNKFYIPQKKKKKKKKKKIPGQITENISPNGRFPNLTKMDEFGKIYPENQLLRGHFPNELTRKKKTKKKKS